MRRSHLRLRGTVVLSVAGLIAACSSGHSSGAADGGSSTGSNASSGQSRTSSGTTSGGTSGTGAGSTTGGTSTAGSSSGTGPGDASGTCIGSSLLGALGKDRLMIGLTGSAAAAAAAPYDLQYLYISGGLFSSTTPCTSCGSCAPGTWWGCYNSPPGMYATDFINAAKAESPAQIPMFTYYEILQTAQATISGFSEGTAEATVAATNSSIMTRYYNDWRFLLQQIGMTQALLHIEPDFWGYVRQAGDPTTLAAEVGSVNPTDCSSLPSTLAGMGQCMILMVRKYAPNAKVGLQGSAWNIAGNSMMGVDVTADATQVAAELKACGTGDFVVVETSDRDAGWYQFAAMPPQDRWWDPTDTNLPDYAQDLAWVKALTEAMGVPALYWQTPLGNSLQNNTNNHYKDNRVDYFFGGSASQVESGAAVMVPPHWSNLAASHVIGVAFGAGASGPTTPDTDGGNLATKTKAYITSGGQALCQ